MISQANQAQKLPFFTNVIFILRLRRDGQIELEEGSDYDQVLIERKRDEQRELVFHLISPGRIRLDPLLVAMWVGNNVNCSQK